MIALDFFLYDNRTWSPRWGRDWGLKAATGALADRADLKADFDRYCGALPSEQGQLRGFGEAIGGVRSGNGYLLCVTLESSDSFGRPSWAVFGLWCPDPATLEQVLSAGDPVGSARALLRQEIPPGTIEIHLAKITVGARRRRHASAAPAFHRFDPRSTVREVISLLLGAVRGRTLPNVLGITATSRLAAVAGAGFDLVYCHPMDERTEWALARVLSPPEPEVEEPWPPPVEPMVPPAPRRRALPRTSPESRSVSLAPWLLALPVAIMAAVVIFLLLGDVWHAFAPSQGPNLPVEEEAPFSGTPAPEVFAPEERSVEAVLGEVRERLEECKDLAPEALRKSPGFVAAETLEVLPEHQERRKRVRQAYSALFEIQGRMVGPKGNYVAYYYYEEGGKDVAPAEKLQKITEILTAAPLGGEECQILKEAFGFEFEDGASVVRQWCSSLGRLENTAVRTGLIPLRHRESP